MSTDFLITAITYLGVVAGAVSGVIEARRKKMDIIGAIAVALITALGGGTLRDLILGRTPVFWVSQESYALVAFFVAILTFYSTGLLVLTSRSIHVPVALGLGVFSILGAGYGIESGAPIFVAILMGVVTGVFGGVLRDVLCNEIPVVFSRTAQLYATCSFVGAWVFLVLQNSNVQTTWASLIGISITVLMRLVAVRFNLRLPNPEE